MILIVDDEASALVLLDMILKRDNYLVRKAATGRDALRLLEREDEQECELIISDISMPEMDGRQLVAQLRANPSTTGIPVIMCTSTADRGTVMSLIGQGVRDYIVKPVSAASLLAKVRTVLDAEAPVMEPRNRTMQRQGIAPGEYGPMARASMACLEQGEEELESALRGRNGRMVRFAAERIREPASWFGAKRTVAAIRAVTATTTDKDAVETGDVLLAEVATLRTALRIATERTA